MLTCCMILQLWSQSGKSVEREKRSISTATTTSNLPSRASEGDADCPTGRRVFLVRCNHVPPRSTLGLTKFHAAPLPRGQRVAFGLVSRRDPEIQGRSHRYPPDVAYLAVRTVGRSSFSNRCSHIRLKRALAYSLRPRRNPPDGHKPRDSSAPRRIVVERVLDLC
jgi:hypothetical protein